MPAIEFIESFWISGGAQYNPGERVMVTEDVARQALAHGAARLVEDAKRLAGPPAHKQMRRAPAEK